MIFIQVFLKKFYSIEAFTASDGVFDVHKKENEDVKPD